MFQQLTFSKLTPKACPHANCGKSFIAPYHHQGILFCPHCHQSLLYKRQRTANVFSHFIKHRKWQVLGTLAFLVIWWLLDTYPMSEKILILAFVNMLLLIIVLVGIEIKARQYLKDLGYPSISRRAILHFYQCQWLIGTDKLQDVQSPLIEDGLKTLARLFESGVAPYHTYQAVYCPHCHSQRLIQATQLPAKLSTTIASKSYDYFCQHCKQVSSVNKTLVRSSWFYDILPFLYIPTLAVIQPIFIWLVSYFVLLYIACFGVEYLQYYRPRWATPSDEPLDNTLSS